MAKKSIPHATSELANDDHQNEASRKVFFKYGAGLEGLMSNLCETGSMEMPFSYDSPLNLDRVSAMEQQAENIRTDILQSIKVIAHLMMHSNPNELDENTISSAAYTIETLTEQLTSMEYFGQKCRCELSAAGKSIRRRLMHQVAVGEKS